MALSLMASQTTFVLHRPAAPRRPALALSLPSAHTPRLPPRLLSSPPISKRSNLRISASISPATHTSPIELAETSNPDPNYLSGATRTVTTLFALAITAARFFARGAFSLAVQLREPLLSAAGPAFFASVGDSGTLNTPLTLVAAGMAKWLELYSGVLLVRVLLSWFPNIPWERQPLCAIRDLCDPYLNLFRVFIPPVFNTLDVSPLLAFGVLGMLTSILTRAKGV